MYFFFVQKSNTNQAMIKIKNLKKLLISVITSSTLFNLAFANVNLNKPNLNLSSIVSQQSNSLNHFIDQDSDALNEKKL